MDIDKMTKEERMRYGVYTEEDAQEIEQEFLADMEREVETRRKELGPILTQLEQLGWRRIPRLLGEVTQLRMLNSLRLELEAALAQEAVVARGDEQDWIYSTCPWERSYPVPLVRNQRREFVKCAQQKKVPMEWMLDAKRRWELGQFSSVGRYIVLGDVYCENEVGLPAKMEVDLAAPGASIGRDSLTYANWCDVRGNIKALRPKINGERFVKVPGPRPQLVGFISYLVPRNFIPDLVEYYAGRYYVLSPLITEPMTYECERDGKYEKVVFEPHPFFSPQHLSRTWAQYYSHKFDGLMVWDGIKEWRTKWIPTAETVIEDLGVRETWEVDSDFNKIRPRYGKEASYRQNVRLKTLIEIRSSVILPFLVGSESSVPVPREKAQEDSRVVFLDSVGSYWGIIEKAKPWNFVGGQVEESETSLVAAIREVKEELSVELLPSDLLYMGDSVTVDSGVKWTSHIFVSAYLPGMNKIPGVIKLGDAGSIPQYTRRIKGYLDKLGTGQSLYHFSQYVLYGVKPPPGIRLSDPLVKQFEERALADNGFEGSPFFQACRAWKLGLKPPKLSSASFLVVLHWLARKYSWRVYELTPHLARACANATQILEVAEEVGWVRVDDGIFRVSPLTHLEDLIEMSLISPLTVTLVCATVIELCPGVEVTPKNVQSVLTDMVRKGKVVMRKEKSSVVYSRN